MLPSKNANRDADASNDEFILALTADIFDTFVKLLEEQHDLWKKSDTRFKSEAWVICHEAIQEKYLKEKFHPVFCKTGLKYILIQIVE